MPVVARARRFALTAPSQSEHDLQIDCTTMLRKILLPDVAWTAIDHAHSLDERIGRHGRPVGLLEAVKRKRRGIRRGVPDYAFWRRARAFAIELKTVDGELSDDQKDFLRELIRAGVEVAVCWTRPQVFQRVVVWELARPGVMA